MFKDRECEEIIKDSDTGKAYRFAGTQGFISKLAMAGRDPSFIWEDLSNGLLPPEEIKKVLMFSLEQVDGNDVDDSERDAVITELMGQAGLVDCSILARIMMSHAMVGAIKKKQIRTNEAIQDLVMPPNRTRWKILGLAGLFVAGLSTASSTLVCMIFKL